MNFSNRAKFNISNNELITNIFNLVPREKKIKNNPKIIRNN